MKYIILFLLSCLLMTHSNAQANIKDSLKILLQKERKDTSRVKLLTDLSLAYARDNADTAMLLALEALSLSQRSGFVKGEAMSLNRIGFAYHILGNAPKAMEVWLQALKLNEKINNLAGLASNLNAIGLVYEGQGEYHQAIDYYLKSKKINEQISNKVEIRINLQGLATSYVELKQYDSARFYAQQIFEVSGKEPYFSMGRIYSASGENKLALEYYRMSINTNWNLNSVFLNMAKLFENEGQIDSTLFYANRAFEISRRRGSAHGVLDASNFLSSFYEKRGKVDSAFFYIKVAKAISDSLFSKEKISQLQSLDFDEKLRQMEIATAELKSKEERKHNLQYAAIAVGLITFIILFLFLSRSIVVKEKFIEFFGVLGLLAVFEFINLFIHPYLAHATNDSPVLMLLILIGIGGLLVPLHHRLEKWMTKMMVEKNKKIRLAAAKRTIEQLESKAVNL